MEKHNAAACLRQADYSPKKLLAIHGGVIAGGSLLLSLVSYLIGSVSTRGGLGAMDMQAALTTAQLVLRLAAMALTPIWSIGLCYAAIGIARGRQVGPWDLTEGFRVVRPLLSAAVWIGGQYLFRGVVSVFLSSQLLSFTPVAPAVIQAARKRDDMPDADLQTLLGADYVPVMLTVLGLFVLVFAVLTLPVFYRYRMTGYLIVDRQEPGGIRAMLRSQMLMYRRRWELAKLDLSFWWYYLLMALTAVISCGGWLLPALGVALPMSQELAGWVFLCAGLLAQLLVMILAGPAVAVRYALRYERYLNEPPVERPQPKTKQVDVQDLPWNY